MKLGTLYRTWLSPQTWLERIGFRLAARLSLGLVLLTIALLLVGLGLRLPPDPTQPLVESRQRMSEIIATQAARAIRGQDVAPLRPILTDVVNRYDDILSAGLRRLDGRLLIQVGAHESAWAMTEPYASTPTQIHVSLYADKKPWGWIELRFAPLAESRQGQRSWWPFAGFTAAGAFLLFWLYLHRMLLPLDPASAVPHRIQALLDTLVEGVVLLDDAGRIVVANETFLRSAFVSPESTIGRRLSTLDWLAGDSDAPADSFPWRTAWESGLPHRGAAMRLRIGMRHARQFNVNASPIFSPDGQKRGVLVTLSDQTAIEADNRLLIRLMAALRTAGVDVEATLHELNGSATDDALDHLHALLADVDQIQETCNEAVRTSQTQSTSAETTPAQTTAKDSEPQMELSQS